MLSRSDPGSQRDGESGSLVHFGLRVHHGIRGDVFASRCLPRWPVWLVADSRTLIAKGTASQRAVVIGASFIGLEVAASLRVRGHCHSAGKPDRLLPFKALSRQSPRSVQNTFA